MDLQRTQKEETSDIFLEILMAYNTEPQTETSVVKFKNQDFRSLRDRCLSRGQLFIDDTFPAEASSIGQKLLKGKSLSKLEWKRPQDLSEDPPHFILEGASRFDIQQGGAGDCWFLAALGSLTQNPQCLQKILMKQSYSHQYAGIFQFRFWQCGQWVEVVVDDRLPVIGKKFLFVHPRRGNQEFWPCLMEKAYAKLLGSYSQIHYGYLPDALVDLTGGVVTIVNLHSSPSDLLMAVKNAVKAGSMVACATPKGLTEESEVMENGLVSQHAYTVTGAEQIRYQRGWEEIIRLWNPWGNTEWRGRWKDGSQEWEESHDPRKSQLYENKDDGEFWMSCQDFQENFSSLFICNQIPITLDHGVTPNERWRQMMFKNQVISRNTAGHRRDAQYLFGVQEPTDGSNVVVAFTIMPQSLKTEEEIFPLHFQVFKFQKFQERLPPAFFSPFRNAAQGMEYVSKCNFTKSFHLSPGTYVVVPSTHRRELEFLLRIFLKMPDKDRNLGNSFNLRALKGSLSENGSQKSIFYRYMDQNQGLDIDATQLQNLLNQEFRTGPPGDTFSLDQCQSIVALMDLKVNGRLDQGEFARLWSRLMHCQHVFQNIQRSPGVLLSSDLWKVVESTDFLSGVFISNELLSLMTLRYSNSSGRVSFPSLVCFLIRLETMAKAFRNLSKDGKGIHLTEVEVILLLKDQFQKMECIETGRIMLISTDSESRGFVHCESHLAESLSANAICIRADVLTIWQTSSWWSLKELASSLEWCRPLSVAGLQLNLVFEMESKSLSRAWAEFLAELGSSKPKAPRASKHFPTSVETSGKTEQEMSTAVIEEEEADTPSPLSKSISWKNQSHPVYAPWWCW